MTSAFFTINGYGLLALALVALLFTQLAWRNYGFLHFLMLIEAGVIAVCLLLTTASAALFQKEGEVLVLFVVAIAAAETAVGIALLLRTRFSPPRQKGLIKHWKLASCLKNYLYFIAPLLKSPWGFLAVTFYTAFL